MESGYLLPAGLNLSTSRTVRILVAEDHPINQLVARKMLEKQGYAVAMARDGYQAVEMWSSDPDSFDAVLMDVEMPGCDGLQATRQIRDLEQYMDRHTPIIAFTAHVMASSRSACIEAGMDAFLTKPVDNKVFYRTIQETLRNFADSEPARLLFPPLSCNVGSGRSPNVASDTPLPLAPAHAPALV